MKDEVAEMLKRLCEEKGTRPQTPYDFKRSRHDDRYGRGSYKPGN